nr:hypothetical protein CFP56_50426 [Quercus suber]
MNRNARVPPLPFAGLCRPSVNRSLNSRPGPFLAGHAAVRPDQTASLPNPEAGCRIHRGQPFSFHSPRQSSTFQRSGPSSDQRRQDHEPPLEPSIDPDRVTARSGPSPILASSHPQFASASPAPDCSTSPGPGNLPNSGTSTSTAGSVLRSLIFCSLSYNNRLAKDTSQASPPTLVRTSKATQERSGLKAKEMIQTYLALLDGHVFQHGRPRAPALRHRRVLAQEHDGRAVQLDGLRIDRRGRERQRRTMGGGGDGRDEGVRSLGDGHFGCWVYWWKGMTKWGGSGDGVLASTIQVMGWVR